MGLGLVSMQTSQKKEVTVIPPPGPPFAANSAFNGVSVDTGTGQIVLGNTLNDPLMPAQLLSARQIVTNGNSIHLDDSLAALQRTELTEQQLLIYESTFGSFNRMQVTFAGGVQTNLQTNVAAQDAILGLNNPTSAVVLQTNQLRPYLEIQNPTAIFRAELVLGVLRVRGTQGTGNGLDIDDTLNRVTTTGTISTAPPASGAGNWKLGTVVAGAVVVDAANSVEVEIGGVTVRLIKAV